MMDKYRDKHLPWARKFLARHDPAYRFRWDIYFEELDKLLGEAQSFLDAGCGDNQTVRETEFAGFKLGVDIEIPANRESFCYAKLDSLPFAEGSFDIIGCRFVLEHLAYAQPVHLNRRQLGLETGFHGDRVPAARPAPRSFYSTRIDMGAARV